MAADNLAGAFAVVAVVTYMSSLTGRGYTATQYALLSSTYAYLGNFTKGFSGVMVESLASGRTLLEGYALFFMGAALLGSRRSSSASSSHASPASEPQRLPI
jgi:PAT family beta-lactamase induction signal transducer AmpG